MSSIVFENLPIIIGVKDLSDPDGIPRIKHMSNRCAKLLGFRDEKEAIGKSDFDLPCDNHMYAKEFIKQDYWVLSENSPLLTLDLYKSDCGDEIGISEKRVFDTKQICITTTLITNTPFARGAYILFGKSPKKVSWQLGQDYPDLGLRKRQQECLFYLIHGRTYKEIAQVLKISHRTVEHHIAQIRLLLKCQSTSQIIDKAYAEGFAYFVPLSLVPPMAHLN